MKLDPNDWRGMAGRLAAEFAIVVLGVTIALWADSWVTERSDRKDEIARLEALRINVESTLVSLNTAIETADGAIEALRKLARPAGHNLTEGEWREVLLYGLLYGSEFSAELNVYDDLKNSGELALLTDAAVRQSLARMDSQLSLVYLAQEDLSTVQVSNIDQYIVDQLDLLPIYAGMLSLEISTAEQSYDYDLAGDIALRNRVLLKLDIVHWLNQTYRLLQDQLRSVNTAIDSQLGDAH